MLPFDRSVPVLRTAVALAVLALAGPSRARPGRRPPRRPSSTSSTPPSPGWSQRCLPRWCRSGSPATACRGRRRRRGSSGLPPAQHRLGRHRRPAGYVLTNEHVIHGAQRIQVVLAAPADGEKSAAKGSRQRIHEARVVGTQASIDLALLRIEATGLPTLPLDPSAKVRQGELVFAVAVRRGSRTPSPWASCPPRHARSTW